MHRCKNINTKIIPFRQKYVKRQQIGRVGLSFVIFCRFDKQDELVNNNNINVKEDECINRKLHVK